MYPKHQNVAEQTDLHFTWAHNMMIKVGSLGGVSNTISYSIKYNFL